MQTIWNDCNRSIPSMGLSVVYQSTAALDPFARNARTHSKRPIRQIADSITTFGFTNPILIDSRDTNHCRARPAVCRSVAWHRSSPDDSA
jgi:hypothetical protein